MISASGEGVGAFGVGGKADGRQSRFKGLGDKLRLLACQLRQFGDGGLPGFPKQKALPLSCKAQGELL